MNATQFLRLAEQFSALAPDVKKTVVALAAADKSAAVSAAGGQGSDTWWGAEFFLSSLAAHGIAPAPRPRNEAPRTMSLFAD
jgi:hypothetical protein